MRTIPLAWRCCSIERSYSIQNDLMGAIVSSYPEHRNGPEFVQCLLDAYADINKVVVT